MKKMDISMNEELLYNQIYEKTKEFGRTQFIREVMRLERENKQLEEQLKQKDEVIDKAIRMLEINIEITSQQPSENKMEDEFILNRYKDLLSILKGEDKEC